VTVELHDIRRRTIAGVRHLDRHLDRIARRHVATHGEILVRERAVPETMTEGEDGRGVHAGHLGWAAENRMQIGVGLGAGRAWHRHRQPA